MNREQAEELVQREVGRQLDALFPHGEGQVNRRRVERALQQVAARAFEQGRQYALTSLLSTDDIADQWGVSRRRVRAVCKREHERHGVGWQTPRGEWLLTPEESERIAPGDPGRPPATEG
jgi:hypothetical protein